tara:strand:- start:611 stop:3979 length:3369 start_codon:yes stop_codon:yes gene_type:complete
MSFFLDEDKATIVSPDEYAQGNKTNYNENLAATWNYQLKTAFSTSEQWNLTNKYGEVVDLAHSLGHTDLTNPMIGDGPSFDETNLDVYSGTNQDFTDHRIDLFHNSLNKKLEEDVNLRNALREKGLDTKEGLERQIGIDAQDALKKMADVRSRATGYGKFGSFVGSAGVVLDPLILGTLPVGFAYNVPKTFLAAAGRIAMVEGILAATAETAIQYGYVGEYRKQLGFEDPDLEIFGLSLSPEQQKIGAATLGAVIGGPALLGLFKGLGKGFDLTGDGLKIIRDKLDELPIHRMKRIYNEVINKNPKFKSEAAETVNKTGLADDDNPFVDTPANNKEFNERSDEMADVLLRDKKPQKILEKPNVIIDINKIDKYDSIVKTLNPEQIEFRPGDYQYKMDGDELGVTKKLKDIEVWDAPSSGTILVHRLLDGTLAVVDGHQRLGLAKRLKAKGQKVELQAHIFDEKDISKGEILIKGMLINLRNNTGSATDAAKVLRTAGKINWDEIKKTLPLKQRLVRNADGLSKLSDDAWGLFLNKLIDEDLAARIGLKIENKSIHNKLLAALSTRKFSSLQEIDSVLEEIKRAPTVKAEQETLFGKEFFEETLIFEKISLIDYVAKNSKKLKDVFKTVLANEKDLSSAGNVLNKRTNLQIGKDNAKIYERIREVASQTGKLSDEFNAAAAILKQGNKQEARRLAEESVRRAVAAGDFDRFSAGGLQRTYETETPSSSVSKEPAAEKVELAEEDLKHVDPTKNPEVIENQINDLDNNLFGEDLPQTSPRTKITIEEEKLVDDIKRDVDKIITINQVEKYLQNQTFKNKIKEAEDYLAKKYTQASAYKTSLRPKFNTKEYFSVRDYGEYGTGSINFLNKFYGEGAPIKEKKLTIVMGPTAAGKSTRVDEIKAQRGAIVTDSDDVKKVLPEFEGGLNSDGVHAESSILNAALLNKATDNGDNVIFPTTGKDKSKIDKVINAAEKKGYTVEVMYITAARPELIARNIVRTFTRNRVVKSEDMLTEDVVKQIEKNYDALNEKYKIGKEDNSTKASSSVDDTNLERSGQTIFKSAGHDLVVQGYSEDIVAKFRPEDEVPDQIIVDPQTNELSVSTVTVRDLLERERQDETFLERLKDC